ncbi:MAG: BON domain-containing protein [Anaerolineae bacterium]
MVVLTIGSEVRCEDDVVGRLANVVLDRHTKEVSHLIVSSREGNGSLVVPMSLVSSWDRATIRLEAKLQEVKQQRPYAREDFDSQASVAEGTAYTPGEALVWRQRYGDVGTSVPDVAGASGSQGDGGALTIGRGSRVYCLDGPLGTVDHVLLKPNTGEVTHLVMKQGALLARSIVVPVDMIRLVDETGIYVDAKRESLLELPTFSLRADEALLSEVKHRLSSLGAELRDAEVSVTRGLVRLSGSVPTMKAKRRAESMVRSIEGVVGVENALTADSAVAAEVTATLAKNPRTRLAAIEVACERGVVSLRGNVDTLEERRAAEEIARSVPGVLLVVNELLVQPDSELPMPFYALQLPALGQIGQAQHPW